MCNHRVIYGFLCPSWVLITMPPRNSDISDSSDISDIDSDISDSDSDISDSDSDISDSSSNDIGDTNDGSSDSDIQGQT